MSIARAAEGDLVAAELDQALGDRDDLRRIDPALVWAAPHRRDVGPHADAGLSGLRDDAGEELEGGVDRLVRVEAVVGLARGKKDGDLGELGVERALEAALVGDEGAEGDAVSCRQLLEEIARVGELGHPLGRDEARDLDALQTGVCERADDALLALEGNDAGLVLQTVTRTDLVDADRVRERREQVARFPHDAHPATLRQDVNRPIAAGARARWGSAPGSRPRSRRDSTCASTRAPSGPTGAAAMEPHRPSRTRR